MVIEASVSFIIWSKMANVAHTIYSFFQCNHNPFSKSSDGGAISRSHSTSIAGSCTWKKQLQAM